MDQELRLPLERQLVSILAANREDAYGTQRKRGWILMDAARRIVATFGLQKWENLGQKHVQSLVEAWKAEDMGRRAIEEKLTYLRWFVKKIGKANLMPRTNRELGVDPGPRFIRAGKIVGDATLEAKLAALQDGRVRRLVLSGRHLGMRMREASLFRPGADVDGNRVWIKRGSKGGQPRYLNIHNQKQREVIEELRRFATGDRSLIPEEFRTFEQWRQYVYRQLREVGISKKDGRIFHDLRRTYAVRRMEGLIRDGMALPAAEKIVSKELGHNRRDILDWYLAEGGKAEAA